jgi:hypothetical protein
MVQGMKNIPAITKYLTNQMRVPQNQIMHLSDAAKDNPAPPTKSVVESTITDFLKSSRKQDHLMLVFVGHAVENDGQVYLAPIEGDLTDPASLIPLAWLYKELDSCVAHQKILVLDVCRFSPTIGVERPGGQPMSAKMEEVIKVVPAGLQVITACSAEQRSMETDGEPLGVFLDGFVDALQKGVQGQIQKQADNIPIDKWFHLVISCKGAVQGNPQGSVLYIYINGNLKQKLKLAGSTPPYQNYGNVYVFSSRTMTVNKSNTISLNNDPEIIADPTITDIQFLGAAKGAISRVFYYSYALTYTEIKTLMDMGPSPNMAKTTENTISPYLAQTWWTNDGTRYD